VLVTFLLCERKVLSRPLLYLSIHLKKHRAEYYDRLQAARIDGDWEGWTGFLLRGVLEVANKAHETARRIVALRQEHQQLLQTDGKGSATLVRALDALFELPMVTPGALAKRLDISYPTANSVISKLEELAIPHEITGRRLLAKSCGFQGLIACGQLELCAPTRPKHHVVFEFDRGRRRSSAGTCRTRRSWPRRRTRRFRRPSGLHAHFHRWHRRSEACSGPDCSARHSHQSTRRRA
jgi:hypothetical protein